MMVAEGDVVQEDLTVDMEEEVKVTLVDKAPNVTSATGSDILPGNVARKKTVATSVMELVTLQGIVNRMRILATTVMRWVTLSKTVLMLVQRPVTSAVG